MPRPEPSPISRRGVLRGAIAGGAAVAGATWLNLPTARAAGLDSGDYTIRYDNGARQTIKGLGFEIQSDSIGSGNNGMPDLVSGVPYDLTPSERTRFYRQMLKIRSDRGFRYCRLALGLYHRGVTADRKRLVDRYEGQTALLAEMVREAKIEGVAAEYWSPAPAWKANNDLVGKSADGKTAYGLASFAPANLDALGEAMVADLDYLAARGIPISMWGLQNEPDSPARYSSCFYEPAQYLAAFKAVAPKIRAKYPNVMIHADSRGGWSGDRGKALIADAQALRYVDAWTYHRVGTNADEQVTGDYTSGALGRPVFNNEFEYLHPTSSFNRTINTAHSIMNWMTFQNAPTWFWLHALKPTTNSESKGYSLGFWRPPSDTDFSRYPNIKAGHWDFNPENWNAVAGFVRYMPWDSVRHHVEEPVHEDGSAYTDHRVMAWKTPQGKQIFAITNRSAGRPWTYNIDTQTAAAFEGHRYGPTTHSRTLGTLTGPTLSLTVPPLSIEFWVRTPEPPGADDVTVRQPSSSSRTAASTSARGAPRPRRAGPPRPPAPAPSRCARSGRRAGGGRRGKARRREPADVRHRSGSPTLQRGHPRRRTGISAWKSDGTRPPDRPVGAKSRTPQEGSTTRGDHRSNDHHARER